MKVLTVVGARPQFIKAAAVSKAFCEYDGINECLVHTGQHYDENMSAVFFRELQIPQPHHSLEIGSGSHGEQTGKMLEAVERVMIQEHPDWVVVYGDTNSTLAGALAAAKLHIPVAHIEAGLRSFNRKMPEEVNRVMADHLSDRLFVPTDAALVNLEREGVDQAKVSMVGDVMYDAALYFGGLTGAHMEAPDRAGFASGEYVLATLHRAENTDSPERLRTLMGGLFLAADEYDVALPLHPRTRKALQREGLLQETERRLQLLPPLGYLEMLQFERQAKVVATDSGGVQKEAFFFRIPCVTLRQETEWVELVQHGWNRLAGEMSSEEVATAISDAARSPGEEVTALYGGGKAAGRIAEQLLHG